MFVTRDVFTAKKDAMSLYGKRASRRQCQEMRLPIAHLLLQQGLSSIFEVAAVWTQCVTALSFTNTGLHPTILQILLNVRSTRESSRPI